MRTRSDRPGRTLPARRPLAVLIAAGTVVAMGCDCTGGYADPTVGPQPAAVNVLHLPSRPPAAERAAARPPEREQD